MESAMSLCCSPLPIAPLRLSPRALRAARGSRIHLRLSHASLCLSHSSTRQPVARSFGPVNCMLEKLRMPSKKEDQSDSKIARGISVGMAGVLGMFSSSSEMDAKSGTAHAWNLVPAAAAPDRLRSIRIANGGDAALESFLKTLKYVAKDPSSSPPKLEDLSGDSLNELKLYVVGRSKFDESYVDLVEALTTEYNKLKKELQKKQGDSFMDLPQEYLEIACIELLIFQEKYTKARDWLTKLIESLYDNSLHDLIKQKNYEEVLGRLQFIADRTLDCDEILEVLDDSSYRVFKAEIILYKAIVHTMLLEDEEAAKWWGAFGKVLGT